MKWYVWLIIIFVVLFVLWMIFWPTVHKVKLVQCTGSPNPALKNEETKVWDLFYHAYPERVKFVNRSSYDGVIITIQTPNFFEGPIVPIVLQAGEESKTFTMRSDLSSGATCDFIMDPDCGQPGPKLIKRP